jgi:2-methylisocitrate lyase-like PEP mutase family enzyme
MENKTTAADRRVILKSLIARQNMLLVPGCYDAVSARLVQDAGFQAVYVGSYATAASRFGLPDTGLVGMTEMVQHAKTVVDSIHIPVLGDAENGFNNAANLWYTIQEFERAGVSGVHIEDHEFGKHTDVPPVILPLDQMAAKIRAAVDAREDPNFLIIARTDVPWALKDMKEAVRRVNAFTDAGADLVFLAGIQLPALREIRDQIKGKVLIANDPGASARDEELAGANVVLYYAFCLYAAYHGVRTALERLKETRDAGKASDLLADHVEFEQFIGFPGFVFKAKKYGLDK